MPLEGLNHYNVAVADLEASRRFYTGVLGLVDGMRPPFETPGAWLYVGDEPVVHLSPAKRRPSKTTGRFDHIAFTASDLPGMVRRLKRKQVDFVVRKVPEMQGNPNAGGSQVFIKDPDGVVIEINFARGERIPRGTPIQEGPRRIAF